jgi:hypothetical protein
MGRPRRGHLHLPALALTGATAPASAGQEKKVPESLAIVGELGENDAYGSLSWSNSLHASLRHCILGHTGFFFDVTGPGVLPGVPRGGRGGAKCARAMQSSLLPPVPPSRQSLTGTGGMLTDTVLMHHARKGATISQSGA